MPEAKSSSEISPWLHQHALFLIQLGTIWDVPEPDSLIGTKITLFSIRY